MCEFLLSHICELSPLTCASSHYPAPASHLGPSFSWNEKKKKREYIFALPLIFESIQTNILNENLVGPIKTNIFNVILLALFQSDSHDSPSIGTVSHKRIAQAYQ